MIREMIVGLGNMGQSHALALHHQEGVEIVALVNRSVRVVEPALLAYPGEHDAIIERVTWDKVHAILTESSRKRAARTPPSSR